MDESRGAAAGQAPPRWVVLVAAGLVLLTGWLMLRMYTSAGVRECHSLYRAAHSAADTARVDTVVTPTSRREQEPRTCGFRRFSARWR